MLWVRVAIGIRLNGTVMHYKLSICDLFNSLLSRVVLSFWWVPGHACWTPRKWTGRLACCNPKPEHHLPNHPVIVKQRRPRYSPELKSLSQNIFCLIPSVSSEELTLLQPRPLWTVSTSMSFYSLVLTSYLCRIKKSTAVSNSSPFGLSRIRASPARHLWHFFIFAPEHWGAARLLSFRGVPPRPHPSVGVW